MGAFSVLSLDFRRQPLGLRFGGIDRGLRSAPTCAFAPSRAARAASARARSMSRSCSLTAPRTTSSLERLYCLSARSSSDLLDVHLGERRVPIILGLADLGLGLTQLRLERLRVHRRNHLTRIDRVPFVGEDFFDAACVFGRDVDCFASSLPLPPANPGGSAGLERYHHAKAPPMAAIARQTRISFFFIGRRSKSKRN